MADSFASNQFYNFNNYEPGNPTIARTNLDNPDFLYPGNLIPNIYDLEADKNKRTNTVVQRGFIRGIYPEIINELNKDTKNKKKYSSRPVAPVRRCFFQFNPSLILRSVDASSSTLNALLQSPNQILQPVTGQSMFEFELLFNREREVSNQMLLRAGGNQPVSATPLQSVLDTYGSLDGNTPVAFSQDHVADLGVLLDLYVLDSIIGQSITADMIDTIQTYWDATKGIRTTTDDEGNTTDLSGTDFLTSDFRNKLSQVLGNSTFLNPMPIRIVFSSLFMVEGFVTASRVAFHKFTKNMVPTVCQVTLSVQALYIGFAKKDSYVSQVLREGIKESNAQDEETNANRDAASVLLDKYINLSLSYLSGARSNGTQSLNSWFAATNDTERFFVSNSRDAFDQTTFNKGLKVWIDQEYKKGIGGTIQDIKINFIRLHFVDISKLPKHLKTQVKFKEYVEKNGLAQMARYGQSIIATVQIYNDFNNKVLKIDSKDIEKLDVGKYYSSEWVSSQIALKDRPLNAYFGTGKIAIVMEVSMSAGYKNYNGDIQTDLVTLKPSILWNFDPTSVSEFKNLSLENGNFSKTFFSTSTIKSPTPQSLRSVGKS